MSCIFSSVTLSPVKLKLSKAERPTKHIIGHIGTGFTGQMTQPTVSNHRRKFVTSESTAQ